MRRLVPWAVGRRRRPGSGPELQPHHCIPTAYSEGIAMLLLIILILLLVGGGGFGYSRYGMAGGSGIVGTILIIILILYLLGMLGIH
jgi:hypothetical protein